MGRRRKGMDREREKRGRQGRKQWGEEGKGRGGQRDVENWEDRGQGRSNAETVLCPLSSCLAHRPQKMKTHQPVGHGRLSQ